MMDDLEKVIKGLECCKNKTCDYARPDVVCPYIEWSGEYETSCYECTKRLAADALALLKAQEPLAVRETELNKCVCGNIINRYWHPEFCGFCGKKLVWF